MYQLLPRFRKTDAREAAQEARINELERQFQKLAEQVCECRTELKPDDVIKSAQEMAGKWPLDIESILGKAVARTQSNLPLPWEE